MFPVLFFWPALLKGEPPLKLGQKRDCPISRASPNHHSEPMLDCAVSRR